MQIGQRRLVIEPGAFRHEALYELQHPIDPIDKSAEDFAGIAVHRALAALVKQTFRFRSALRWRQIEKSQEVARFIAGAGFLELRLALGIDPSRRYVWKRIR